MFKASKANVKCFNKKYFNWDNVERKHSGHIPCNRIHVPHFGRIIVIIASFDHPGKQNKLWYIKSKSLKCLHIH